VEPRVVSPDEKDEFATPERCSILETWNDESDHGVSITRARVEPGVTTQLHSLDVDERYLVVSGVGVVSVGDLAPARVKPGDAVVIPAGEAQRIENTGNEDLIFYCICTPPFRPEGYTALGP
jgi:mannose-6-phosphate isomerase-like protein (cupin superfamily)